MLLYHRTQGEIVFGSYLNWGSSVSAWYFQLEEVFAVARAMVELSRRVVVSFIVRECMSLGSFSTQMSLSG